MFHLVVPNFVSIWQLMGNIICIVFFESIGICQDYCLLRRGVISKVLQVVAQVIILAGG